MSTRVRTEEAPQYQLPGVPPPADEDQIIRMAREIIERRFSRGESIQSPAAVREYLQVRMAEYVDEVFAVLWLDNRHRVIELEEIFRGTIDGASVHPRGIVRSALEHNAAACILVHNHPSGVPEPSMADRNITNRLKEALAFIDTNVLDHIVVAGGGTVSLAERGML